MKYLFLPLIIFFLCIGEMHGQTSKSFTYNGLEKERTIKSGKGKKYQRPFIGIGDFHFIQFGVYPVNVDPVDIGAPDIDNVWIIYHKDTKFEGRYGVYYIVKPYISPDQARQAVKFYRKKGISCWYNSELTGATFVLMGSTTGKFNEGELN